jgi:hypothetical protein
VADKFATEVDLATLLQQDLDTASATLALELATGAIQDEAGWRIVAETVSNYLCTYAGNMVVLPTAHLTALTMTDAGTALVQGNTMLWSTNGLVLRKAYGGMIDVPFYGPVVATFTHGYPADSIPQKLRGLCLNIASRLYDNPTGLRSEGVGQSQEVKSPGGRSGSSNAGPTLTEDELRALTPWLAEVVAVST